MSSREKILQAIQSNKPKVTPLPESTFQNPMPTADVVATFTETLLGIGGYCSAINGWDTVKEHWLQLKQKNVEIVNSVDEVGHNNSTNYIDQSAAVLQNVNTIFIKGAIAVAENAAVWVPERNIINRILPFICENLVIVVDKKDVVANMHEAYQHITIDEGGFGVFIAGPSKTADIEQSLVIGAHGPLSLYIYIIEH